MIQNEQIAQECYIGARKRRGRCCPITQGVLNPYPNRKESCSQRRMRKRSGTSRIHETSKSPANMRKPNVTKVNDTERTPLRRTFPKWSSWSKKINLWKTANTRCNRGSESSESARARRRSPRTCTTRSSRRCSGKQVAKWDDDRPRTCLLQRSSICAEGRRWCSWRLAPRKSESRCCCTWTRSENVLCLGSKLSLTRHNYEQ